MRGTDIEDVYLILRNGCNEANAVFLASLKIINSGEKIILMQRFLMILN